MKKILLLVFLLTIGTANAGILLEPYLGYVVSGKVESGNENNRSYTVPTLGARVGYQMLGFMAGFEYNMLSPSWEDDQPPLTAADLDMKHTNMGLFVGFNFPVMLRVWGTMFFKSEAEIDSLAGSIGDTYSGSGKGLGVGFTGLPFLSINLEYKMFTYDEHEDVSTGVVTKYTSNGELEVKEIVLSVSLPFELPF
jgi:hypothetical protein